MRGRPRAQPFRLDNHRLFQRRLHGQPYRVHESSGTREMTRFSTPRSAVGRSGRQIDHIVVLMMENRSFDHMLGYLRLKKGRGDIDGLTSPLQNTNPVPGSQNPQEIFELDFGNILVDPGHSHEATLEQIAGGDMSGFVANYLKRNPAPNAFGPNHGLLHR